jgi:hypothetical protein
MKLKVDVFLHLSALLVVGCMLYFKLVEHDYAKNSGCDCLQEHCLPCHKKQCKIEEMEVNITKLYNIIDISKTVYSQLLTTDKMVRFYTGLPKKTVFDHLFDYVRPKVSKMHYWRGSSTTPEVDLTKKSPRKKRGRGHILELKDELLLTLMKLRLGLLTSDLAHRFHISEGTVSSVFTTWIKVLSSILEPLVKMPSPECIHANLPVCFRKYKNLRGILDCTEVFIETPRDLKLQALTWSDYKKHNTIKFLVVITPRG